MEQFPEAGFGLSSLPEPGRVYPVLLQPKEIYLEHFFGFGHFDRAPGSAIIKKSVFDAVGGFSGKRMIGDFEMWFTLARKFSMVKYPRELVWTRHHAGQEFQSAYAKQYPVLRKQVIDTALLHPDCPLNQTQIKLVQSKIFKDNIKYKIQHFFSSFWRSLAS
jgi:hypothetical protein